MTILAKALAPLKASFGVELTLLRKVLDPLVSLDFYHGLCSLYICSGYYDFWTNMPFPSGPVREADLSMLMDIEESLLGCLRTIVKETSSSCLRCRGEKPLALEDGTAKHRLAECFGSFSFRTFLTKWEVVVTRNQLRSECAKVRAMSLFNTSMTKTVRLDEFIQAQIQVRTIAPCFKRHFPPVL